MADKQDWVYLQQKTFTKWVNNNLSKKGFKPMKVDKFEKSWEDGIKLMQLINSLYGTTIPKYKKKPKGRPQKIDNISLALKMIKDNKIKTNFLGANNLLDHDKKMLLGMVWAIILDYAIKGISEGDLTAKEGLLMWVQKKTKGYKDVDPPKVKNFHKDWKSGLAFCALIHRHHPDLIDYESLDKHNGPENLELAFSTAEKLGIPRLLDVEDLAVKRPDEKSVMTQVAEYYAKFAQQSALEDSARRIQNFLNFHRNLDIKQTEYETRCRELIQFFNDSSNNFSGEDFGNSLPQAIEKQQEYRTFVVEDKPPKSGEKLDIETLFAEIQTELKINNRKEYCPPEGLSLEDMEEAENNLNEAQKKYSTALRHHRLTFVKKVENELSEEELKEFEASFDKFDADKSGQLDFIEFKAALVGLGVPTGNDKQAMKLFKKQSGGDEHISREQFISYLVHLKEDKDTPESTLAAFSSLAGGSDSKISDSQLNCYPLTKEDGDYLKKVMPKDGNSYNFNEYVNNTFA